MRGGVVLVGLVLLVLGAWQLSGFYVLYATSYVNSFFSLFGSVSFMVAVAFVIVGAVLMGIGMKLSKMGKWYSFY